MTNFNLTPSAIQEVKRQKEKRANPNAFLRLGVKGGSCEGYAYVIEWQDNPPREKDLVFDFEGEKILIDPKSFLFLEGATLDFEKTLMKSGFKFVNPKEVSKCGCGLSVGFEE